MFLHDRLIKAGGLFKLVFLHKEHMGYVQLPSVMLIAELHRFAENLLHLRVILHVPVDLGLLHQYWDVAGRTREHFNTAGTNRQVWMR